MAWPRDWAPSEEVAGPGSTGESNSSVLLLCPEWAHLSPNFWKKHILWMKTTSWEEEVCSQHSYHELDEWTSIWSLMFLTTLCLLYLRTYWSSYTASRTYKWHCSCMVLSVAPLFLNPVNNVTLVWVELSPEALFILCWGLDLRKTIVLQPDSTYFNSLIPCVKHPPCHLEAQHIFINHTKKLNYL